MMRTGSFSGSRGGCIRYIPAMNTGKGKGIHGAICEAARYAGNLLRGPAFFSCWGTDGVSLVCSTSVRSGELVENRTLVCLPSHSCIEEGSSSGSALLFSEVAD